MSAIRSHFRPNSSAYFPQPQVETTLNGHCYHLDSPLSVWVKKFRFTISSRIVHAAALTLSFGEFLQLPFCPRVETIDLLSSIDRKSREASPGIVRMPNRTEEELYLIRLRIKQKTINDQV